MRAFEFIIEGYREAKQEFAKTADPAEVEKAINDFKQLVSRNQIKDLNQKNIDWWRKQGWDEFSKFVQQQAAIPSKTQIVRKKIPGKSINLLETDEWLVVVPLDKDASCFHGKNSDWCTTKVNQSYFEEYFYDEEVTLIYCLNKKTAGMWAIAAHKELDEMEIFNQRDKKITPEEFQQQTGLDPEDLRSKAMSDEYQSRAQASRDQWRESVDKTEKLLDQLPRGARSGEIQKLLIYNKHRDSSVDYIEKVGRPKSKSIPEIIQLTAVRKDGAVIQDIEDPSEKVQFAAVDRDRYVIQLIDEPTERVQMKVVEEEPKDIGYINDPTVDVQLKAIELDNGAFEYIENPSEWVQLVAVEKNPYNITYIDDPTEEVQILAVEQDYGVIVYLGDPSEQVQLAAVEQEGRAIQFIENPSEQVQLAAVGQDGVAIKYIKNPSERVQLAAVGQDSFAFEYIKNPTERVQQLVQQDN